MIGVQQESAELAARGRGDGLRHPGREGLRRRAAARPDRLGDEADDVYDVSMESGPHPVALLAGARAAAEPRSHRRPGLRRPPGARRRAHARRARGVQRLRGPADLAPAHARHDHRQAQRAAASGQRVHEVLADRARGASTRRTPCACPPPGGRGPASSACASATGSGGPVLDGLRSGRSRPGSRSRSSAPPACGKSTVAKLVPALLRRRPAAGSCSTASTCATPPCDEVRRAVGLVFEDTFLFSDSIAANIAFADPDAPIGADRAGRPPGRGPRVHQRAAPRLRTPRSASGATRCRADSASASPSPGPSSPTPGS